jgi:uncharacterized membrane protein
MKFTITVTITAQQTIEIDAPSEDEARSTAVDQFNFDESDILDIITELE